MDDLNNSGNITIEDLVFTTGQAHLNIYFNGSAFSLNLEVPTLPQTIDCQVWQPLYSAACDSMVCDDLIAVLSGRRSGKNLEHTLYVFGHEPAEISSFSLTPSCGSPHFECSAMGMCAVNWNRKYSRGLPIQVTTSKVECAIYCRPPQKGMLTDLMRQNDLSIPLIEEEF